ncbi:hypothetical protein JW977_05070 [Candidatus Falkowbacteria bacterium]|nr:hypothetical protein [Candidatus Falkowbacteria bacterium]
MSEIYHVKETCQSNCEKCPFKNPNPNTILAPCFGKKGMDVRFFTVKEIVEPFIHFLDQALCDCVTRTQVIISMASQGFRPGCSDHFIEFRDAFPNAEQDFVILHLGGSYVDDGTHWAGKNTRFMAVRKAI